MKKHLIAAAVAGAFAVPAMAQVTVFGLLDVGYTSTESVTSAGVKTEASTFGASGSQSGGRLGFRGEEDLGGGMKAGFMYELSLDPTESNYGGSSGIGNRQGYLLVSGGFGEVRLGRQYTGFFGVNAGYDAGGTVGGAGYLPSSAQLGSTEWTGAIRANNVVRYQTPTMNGFYAVVAFADDSSKGTAANGTLDTQSDVSGQTFIAAYSAGPLSAMLSYNPAEVETRTAGNVLAAKADQTRTNLGVSYNLGVLSLHVTHNIKEIDDKTPVSGSNGNKDSDYSDTTIGVKVPLGAATIWASTGEGELKNKGNQTGTTEYSAYQLGVSYALSKRTNVYAYMGEDEGKAKTAGARKATNEGMYLGVRHSF